MKVTTWKWKWLTLVQMLWKFLNNVILSLKYMPFFSWWDQTMHVRQCSLCIPVSNQQQRPHPLSSPSTLPHTICNTHIHTHTYTHTHNQISPTWLITAYRKVVYQPIWSHIWEKKKHILLFCLTFFQIKKKQEKKKTADFISEFHFFFYSKIIHWMLLWSL